MAAWIRDRSDLGALVPAWVSVRLLPEGLRPCGVGCGMVAWIRDGSNQGALALA